MSEVISPFTALRDALGRLFQSSPKSPTSSAPADSGMLAPLQPRVLMIVYNPIVDQTTGMKLIDAMHWNDPDQLAATFISDVHDCSSGLVNYQIAQRLIVDDLPVKKDGFRYTPQDYVTVVRTQRGAHDPDAVDYGAMLAQFNILSRVAQNEIDEVWLFGGPYFGFWESAMGGAGAFFCNGEPLANTAQCPRRFVVMGFNYERGVGEMLEDLGHRAEAILAHLFGSESFLQWAYTRGRSPATVTGTNLNALERFLSFDQIAPGRANVGSVHYAPNSLADYEWGVTTRVGSCADDWKQYPNLPDPPSYRAMNTREWGGGEIRAHHQWWLAHLPHVAGATNGIANNWWKYFCQLNDPIFDQRR